MERRKELDDKERREKERLRELEEGEKGLSLSEEKKE